MILMIDGNGLRVFLVHWMVLTFPLELKQYISQDTKHGKEIYQLMSWGFVIEISISFMYYLVGKDHRWSQDLCYLRNELKVPQGNYYLCDGGYTNGNGFCLPTEYIDIG
ncbi:hypothetical protein H5410_063036 [Solanum commersonii]|uniref:DDE Tnp4 domain-containing protein n=1 Tax=Solanum commersonii TaxID=4109 RepID=A0A9J5WEG1_SOLCO|nr:hypothetical protein H5410_063036 [Solanum commersonii]